MVKRYVSVQVIYVARWADIDITDVMKWTKPSPLCFCTLQVIQDWRGGRPSDKAIYIPSCCPVTYSMVLSSLQPCAPNKTGS